MELQQIVNRYAECLEHVDATTTFVGVNRRTGETYQPGVPAMTESAVVPLLDDAWEVLYPRE